MSSKILDQLSISMWSMPDWWIWCSCWVSRSNQTFDKAQERINNQLKYLIVYSLQHFFSQTCRWTKYLVLNRMQNLDSTREITYGYCINAGHWEIDVIMMLIYISECWICLLYIIFSNTAEPWSCTCLLSLLRLACRNITLSPQKFHASNDN